MAKYVAHNQNIKKNTGPQLKDVAYSRNIKKNTTRVKRWCTQAKMGAGLKMGARVNLRSASQVTSTKNLASNLKLVRRGRCHKLRKRFDKN